MARKRDTPHAGGASRKRCGVSFRDPNSPAVQVEQLLPDLIALHLGPAFCAIWDGKEVEQ